MKVRSLLAGLVACGLLVSMANAEAVFRITEIYNGLSGPDGTQDWFEVTNYGDMAGNTGDLWYDDSNPVLPNAGPLDPFVLAPGESAVFLLDSAPKDDVTYATAIGEFNAIWGPGINVGIADGGGGLSNDNRDSANLLDFPAGNILSTLFYPDSAAGTFETFELTRTGRRLSVLGENGAYESTQFANDNFGTAPDFLVSLVGSPGTAPAIPEPSSVALVGLGLVATLAIRRRK